MSELKFKVSSGLKDIIGRDLISDDFIAVFELVKNSFDAYATEVQIIFENDKLLIIDDGKGMDFDDLQNKWLFVAYSAKKEGVEDEEIKTKEFNDYRNKIVPKRYYAGAKGIGRFSSDRLGKKLKLVTKKANKGSKLEQLLIDWGNFEKDANLKFEDITIKYNTLEDSKYPDLDRGTILEISGLRSTWNRQKKQELKQSLEKLINPFDLLKSNSIGHSNTGFKINIKSIDELDADKEEESSRFKVNGEVRNFIFETINIKTTQIITTVDQTGTYITTELIDRGTQIYKIKERNEKYPLLSDIQYHLFYLNRAAKINFKKQLGIHVVEFGSVFLYKNGFRVYPFGEEGDDTLELDRRKAQGYARFLGSRDVVGRIDIIGDNEDFKETSSRDGGLKKTSSYFALVDCFRELCLKRLERYVVDIQWAIKDKDEDDIVLIDNVNSKSNIIEIISKLSDSRVIEDVQYNKDFLNIINDRLEEPPSEAFENLSKLALQTNDRLFFSELTKAKKEFEKEKKIREEAERKVREEIDKRQREEAEKKKIEEQLEIERKKNLFLLDSAKKMSPESLGLVHHIVLETSNIDAKVQDLISSIKEDNINKNAFLKDLIKIKIHSDKTLKISKLITRSNFDEQASKQKGNLAEYIKQYINAYSDLMDENKLTLKVESNNALYFTRFSILEISIIFDNLISNAKKANAKNILVQIKDNSNNAGLQVIFSDDGEGLSEKYQRNIKDIFSLGITSTTGSGIGLYTVKDLLNKMKGEVNFIGNGKLLRGATFQIIFN